MPRRQSMLGTERVGWLSIEKLPVRYQVIGFVICDQIQDFCHNNHRQRHNEDEDNNNDNGIMRCDATLPNFQH